MELEASVERHYQHGSLEQAIIAGLIAAGKDPDQLIPTDLAPVDEFHVGGRVATVEFAERLGVKPGQKWLDVGSGLGGASRYFAGELGCDVTGIDLTEEYVAVADMLARRVGLQSRVRYRRASALNLPFANGEFDGVYMIHVGSNIADKAALFREFRRVLAPGGVVGVYDLMREQPGDISYPVPWTTDASADFLESFEVYALALQEAGFEVSEPNSRREFALAFFERLRAATAKNGGAPPPLGLHIVMGARAREKMANMVDNLQRGLISPTEIIAQLR